VRKKKINGAKQEEELTFKPKVYSALVICLSKDIALRLQSEGQLPKRFYQIRENIFSTYGVYLPDLQFDIDVNKTGDSFKLFLNGTVCSEYVCESSSQQITGYVAEKLEEFILQHIEELINDTHTRFLIEAYNWVAEDLINSVIPDAISVTGLTILLKQLIQEKVSIKEFTNILQTVAVHKIQIDHGIIKINNQMVSRQLLDQLGSGAGGNKANFYNELLAEVRVALKRTISRSLKRDDGSLSAVLLDGELDKMFSLAAYSNMPVSGDMLEVFYNKIQDLKLRYGSLPLVILSSKFARRQIYNLVSQSHKDVSVIAVDELTPDTKLEILETLAA